MSTDTGHGTVHAHAPEDQGLTAYVARFIGAVSFADLPHAVIERSRCSVLDGLGLGLAARVSSPGRVLDRYLNELQLLGPRGVTVIGKELRASPRFAAFANGIALHSDDFDDTQLAVAPDRVYGLLTHPTAPVLPAALAVAEERNGSGADLLLAYNIGVEVETKIAEAIDPRHYEDGFHSTGTCGTFGAAAAASRLRGLGVVATRCALSIAGSESAGLRENFGTMTKPFHAGRAAEAGVIAAHLAALGWTASLEPLAAPRGFFHAAGGGYDEASIRDRLGAPWTFADPGISIKPHPSGSLTHPAMTEMTALIKHNDIRPDQVVKVVVGTNAQMPNALIHHRPTTELEAKFSMEFCMAVLLVEGRAGLAEFNTAMVNSPAIQDMIGRVEFRVDAEAEAAGYDKMTSIIMIQLADGREIHGRSDFGKGSPSDPMSFEDVARKFHDCASFADWPRSKSTRIVELVRNLQELDDITELTACLRP